MKLTDYIKAELGTQAELCRRIGAHAPDMSRWLKGVRPIPEDACAAIERATGGVCTCEENLPGARWVRVPDPDWPHPDGRPAIEVAKPLQHPTPDAPRAAA